MGMTVEERAAAAAAKVKAKAEADAKEAEEKILLNAGKKRVQKEKDAAKRAKDKEKAKIAAQAKVKGAHETALRKLAPIAKEIDARLTKANKMEDDAYDHRLAAALQLDKAKKECATSKINFKQWCETNITVQSYETIRKLVAVGGSADPAGALEDMRGRNKKANKKLRDKQKTEKAAAGKKAPSETPATRILHGFDNIKDEEGANLIAAQAPKYGLAVASVEDVKAAREMLERSKASPVAQILAIFARATPAEKMEIVKMLVAEVGVEIVGMFNPEDGSSEYDAKGIEDIPASLDKRPKRGRAAA